MTLRDKVAVILLGSFALFGGLDDAVQRITLAPSFLALEREEVGRNVDRAVQAVLREAQLLAPSAADWAVWDDTYRYIADRNPAYEEGSLTTESLQNLKVNALALYDVDGGLVWGRALELETGKMLDLPLASRALPAGHPFLSLGARNGGFAGLFREGERLLLVAGHPILTSQGEGPSRGLLLVARFLDDAAFRRIGEQARLHLSVQPAAAASSAWLRSQPGGIPHTAATLQEGPAVTRATTVLGDLSGRPVLELLVDTPREITARGRSALRFARLSLVAAACTVLVVLMVLLRRTVLEPLDRLTRHAVALGRGASLGSRLDLEERADELGTLAREFNVMTGYLAEARRELLEQSYRSGVAETASGVLHNIGNAVTPLKVGLANLAGRFGQAPAEDLERALDELARPDTPPERRALLAEFAALAGREIARLARSAPAELGALARQVEHVQQIVGDQEAFSRAARVVEPVPLGELVAESTAVLGAELRRDLTVSVDPGLSVLEPAYGSRVALQQVVVNLLVNAAEAVRASGCEPGSGLLTIDAFREEAEGGAAVHLRFTDNGVGIPEEHLTRIFARGFSTKQRRRSSGLGLHWSATTVHAMGGRLFAESDGPGTGARLHLVLPTAPQRGTHAA